MGSMNLRKIQRIPSFQARVTRLTVKLLIETSLQWRTISGGKMVNFFLKHGEFEMKGEAQEAVRRKQFMFRLQ